MNDDPLQQMLQAAEHDPHVVVPPFTADALLAAARRRRLRRTATRSATAATAVALIAAPLLTWDWSLKRPVRLTQDAAIAHAPVAPHLPAPDIESLQLELARLERDAAMHQQIIAAVLTPNPPDELPVSLGLSDAELVRLETARNAALSLEYASMAERELDDVEVARREYQRVADRFPETDWARYAVVSLRRLDEPAKEPAAL
jgi:hypothetical protein